MTRTSDLDELYADMPLLGHTVSWLLRGVEVSYDDLKKLLEDHGFASYVPTRPPPAKRAIRRAIRDWIVWRIGRPVLDDDDDDGEDIDTRVTVKRGRGARSNQLIRTVGDEATSKWLVFSLITENRDVQDLSLEYATDVRFFFSKADVRLLCTTEARGVIAAENESARIAREIAPFWERHKSLYLSGDISRVLTAIMPSLGAVSVREGGGSYFSPMDYQEGLDRLKTLVAAIPTAKRPAALLTFPLLDVALVREQVRRAADEDFYAELDRAEKDLQRFVEQNDAKPGSVKAGTLTARIHAYIELRRKAHIYADSAGMRQERILDDLDALERRARTLLAAAGGTRDERAEDAEIDLSRLYNPDHTDREQRTA